MGFYRKIEDAYYKFMDFLNDKVKIPVYDFFVKPIETRGIPSLPVFVLLLLLLVCGVFLLAFGLPGGGGEKVSLTVFVSSGEAALDGATVSLAVDGSEISSSETRGGGKAVFEDVPAKELIVTATMEGYKQARERFTFPEKSTVRLELKCLGEACASQGTVLPTAPKPTVEINFEDEAKLVVIVSDAKTGALVSGAKVNAYKASSNTLVGTGLVVGGQAALTLDAGTTVYVNVEADGYLPYDGSSKASRLKAGTTKMQVKLTPATQGGCVDGTNSSCVTPDGYAGRKTCRNGVFGACAATARGCSQGASISCLTSDNCNGTQSCNSTGFYGACVKLVSSCSSRCVSGNLVPCVTAEGFNGTKSCNSTGFWGECSRNALSCNPGNTTACVTSDACNGTLTCNSSGLWGECVKLSPPQCSGTPNYGVSVVRVSYANSTPIAGVRLDVYNASEPATPLVRNKLTDANGSYAFNLSNANGALYFAVATKTGFYDEPSANFSAGQNAAITLTPVAPESKARLRASAFDDENAGVNGASFVLFATNAQGQLYRAAEKTASSSSNFVVFDDLRRGAYFLVNASKGASAGSTATTASAENNSVNITLVPEAALLRFQAIDLESGAGIAGARFAVARLNASAGGCTGVNCTVVIRSGRFYNATASAAGYSPASFVFEEVKALAGQELNLTAEMISADSVEETAATLVSVTEAATGLAATHLVAGREYVARFQLTAKSGASLTGTGLHVSFAENGVAFFTGYSPRAAVELAGASSEEGGCNGLEGEEGLVFDGKRFQWLDVEFDGARSAAIDVRFKIAGDARLDPRTRQGTLTMKYRSFGRRGSGAAEKILRNPFDASLGVALDSPLESGCNAAALESELPVAATVCDENACLWLSYEQGGEEGGEGFEAESMARINPATSDFKPLLAHYAIEFLKAPAQTQGLALKFAAPAGAIDFKNFTNPLADLNDCGSANSTLPASGSSWTLDLSRVAQCSNYGRFPLKLEGVAEGVPLAESERVAVSLDLVSGSKKLLERASWLKIVEGGATKPGEGDAAELRLVLSQKQGDEVVEEARDSNEIFNAGIVSVNNLQDLRLEPAQQDYSLVQGDFKAHALFDVYDASLEIGVADSASSPLKFVGVQTKTGFLRANSEGKVVLSAGELKRGAEITGRALFAPVLASGVEYAYAKISLRFTARQWGAAAQAIERQPKNVFVSREFTPGAAARVDWFAGDDCGGALRVSYDAENGLSLGEGCSTLVMKINSVLPADAVPVASAGGRNVKISVAAGDKTCFSNAASFLSDGALKYDASKCARDEFKVHGNNVAGQTATVKFYVLGGTYNEFSQCPSGAADVASAAREGFACLTVRVESERKPSLYASQINFKSYRGSYVDLTAVEGGVNAADVPLLFVVTNNQQYPAQRELKIIHDEGEESFSLKSGESKAFAFKGRDRRLFENNALASVSESVPSSASTEFEAVKAIAFRRSNRASMVCRTDQSDCVGAENLALNWASCCKASVDAWRDMQEVEYVAGRVSCQQCKPFTQGASEYNCDNLCAKDVAGESGYAFVLSGESFYDGKAVLTCTENETCGFACTSWCDAPTCDSECGADGIKLVKDKRVEQVDWLENLRHDANLQNPALAVVDFEAGEENEQKDWPLAEFGGADIKVSTVKNLLASGDTAKLEEAEDDVEDCMGAGKHIDYYGVYVVAAETSGEGYKVGAKALTLSNKPESYLGYSKLGSDASKACAKGNADDVNPEMAEVPLCAYLWVDQSSEFGTCVNSIYSFEDPNYGEGSSGALTQLNSLRNLKLVDDSNGFVWKEGVAPYSQQVPGLCRQVCDGVSGGGRGTHDIWCLADYFHNGGGRTSSSHGWGGGGHGYFTESDEKGWDGGHHGSDCQSDAGAPDSKECFLCLPEAYRQKANRLYILKKTETPQEGFWIWHGLDVDTQPPFAFLAAPVGGIIAGVQKFPRAAGGETTTGFQSWSPLGTLNKYCKIGSQCGFHQNYQEEVGSLKYCFSFHAQTGADISFCDGAMGTMQQLSWYEGDCRDSHLNCG